MNCLRCGECCKKLTLEVNIAESVLCDLFKIHYNKDADVVAIRINHRCPHLGDDSLCQLYGDPRRPDFCSEWYCDAAKGNSTHAIRIELEDS